jgi:hypothetical protein
LELHLSLRIQISRWIQVHKMHGYTSNPHFCSEILGWNCVYRAQLLHQFVMFTINCVSLRNSSICRDYQFTADHQKSYLTPNSKANFNANSNADTNANAAVNATGISGAYGPFETQDVNTDSTYITQEFYPYYPTLPRSSCQSIWLGISILKNATYKAMARYTYSELGVWTLSEIALSITPQGSSQDVELAKKSMLELQCFGRCNTSPWNWLISGQPISGWDSLEDSNWLIIHCSIPL